MTRSFVRSLAAALVLAALGTQSTAEEFQCRSAEGCEATRTKNGTTVIVVFRRGDLVGTESGWVVDPANGWQKVNSGRGPVAQ